MDKRTQKITYGAAILAIFALMVLFNRQTGSFFEEFMLYLFPVPMLAFSVRYGWKNSLPLLFCMGFFAFLFGNFSTVFYAVSEALIGLVFGECIYRKADQTKTMFIVMVLSAIVNVLNTIVLAGLFGIDLETEIEEMYRMTSEMMEQFHMQLPPGVITMEFMKQAMVIMMVVLGLVQGFVIYQISILILRRLQFQIPRPKSVFLFFPPKWTGYVSLAAVLTYFAILQKNLDVGKYYDVIQVMYFCGVIYLLGFGFVAIIFFFRFYKRMGAFVSILACVLAFSEPMITFFIGFLYIVTSYHYQALKTMKLIP